jgi:hypothetical protein
MLATLWHREILPERATAYRDVFRGLVLDAQPALLQAQLYCVIAYESIFGDQRIVPDLCRLLYDRTKQQRPDLFVEAATRAGFGLLRSGEVLEALDLFEQVYQVADRAELRSARSEMCMLLGSFRLDLDQPECTQRWLDRLKVHSEESARHAGREFAAAVISVELALYRGDIAAVQAITSRKEIYDRLGFALRARRWQTALGLLDAHLRGAAVDISSAEAELRRYHMEEFECGEPGDFETALTALLYRERGDAALARSRVLHYLHANRRPGFPLTPFLRQTARSVSLSEDEMQAILKGKRKQPRSVQHSLKLPAEWFRKRGNR